MNGQPSAQNKRTQDPPRAVPASPSQRVTPAEAKTLPPLTPRVGNPASQRSGLVTPSGQTRHNAALDDEIAKIKAGLQSTPLQLKRESNIVYPPQSAVMPQVAAHGQDFAAMTNEELKQLCALVEESCGIHIDETKKYLLETRLLKTVVSYGCHSYSDFIRLARGAKKAEIYPKLIDAMTTKETLWFRDTHPYETLKEHLLPELLRTRGKMPVKIWSAACSTGQEAYSIAMCVHEFVRQHPEASHWLSGGLRILGTDVASSSIMLSKLGRYDMVAMGRGMSEERKARFFTQQGRAWMLNEEVKRLCDFRMANLQGDLITAVGTGYDLVFLRNVAIYFTKDFKQGLYNRLAKVLKPDGTLIIGSTESMMGLQTPFASQNVGRTTLYKLK